MRITDKELLEEIEEIKGFILLKRAAHELARDLDPKAPPCQCEAAILKAEWCLAVTQQLYDLRQLTRDTQEGVT